MLGHHPITTHPLASIAAAAASVQNDGQNIIYLVSEPGSHATSLVASDVMITVTITNDAE